MMFSVVLGHSWSAGLSQAAWKTSHSGSPVHGKKNSSKSVSFHMYDSHCLSVFLNLYST